jgi:hypothetical protein
VGDEPALVRFQIYGLAELTAVLGEPVARREFDLSEFLRKAPHIDRPLSPGDTSQGFVAPAPKQLLVWRCGPHARDSCMAMGDPQVDRWLATKLCNVHGGVPYDEATPASDEQLTNREQWITTLWSILSAWLPGLDRSSPGEACYAEKRVRVDSQAAGSSIEAVANISFKVLDEAESPAKLRMSGSFYTVNATPTYAACALALELLMGQSVRISTTDEVLEGTLLPEPANAGQVLVALSNGSRRSIDCSKVQVVQPARDPEEP